MHITVLSNLIATSDAKQASIKPLLHTATGGGSDFAAVFRQDGTDADELDTVVNAILGEADAEPKTDSAPNQTAQDTQSADPGDTADSTIVGKNPEPDQTTDDASLEDVLAVRKIEKSRPDQIPSDRLDVPSQQRKYAKSIHETVASAFMTRIAAPENRLAKPIPTAPVDLSAKVAIAERFQTVLQPVPVSAPPTAPAANPVQQIAKLASPGHAPPIEASAQNERRAQPFVTTVTRRTENSGIADAAAKSPVAVSKTVPVLETETHRPVPTAEKETGQAHAKPPGATIPTGKSGDAPQAITVEPEWTKGVATNSSDAEAANFPGAPKALEQMSVFHSPASAPERAPIQKRPETDSIGTSAALNLNAPDITKPRSLSGSAMPNSPPIGQPPSNPIAAPVNDGTGEVLTPVKGAKQTIQPHAILPTGTDPIRIINIEAPMPQNKVSGERATSESVNQPQRMEVDRGDARSPQSAPQASTNGTVPPTIQSTVQWPLRQTSVAQRSIQGSPQVSTKAAVQAYPAEKPTTVAPATTQPLVSIPAQKPQKVSQSNDPDQRVPQNYAQPTRAETVSQTSAHQSSGQASKPAADTQDARTIPAWTQHLTGATDMDKAGLAPAEASTLRSEYEPRIRYLDGHVDKAQPIEMTKQVAPPATPAPTTPQLTVQITELTKHSDGTAKEEISWDIRPHAAPTAAPTQLSHGRPEMPPHLAQQIAQALHRTPDRPLEIALNPAELGRVRMTLSATETGIVVNILADRPDTLDLMRRNIDDLGQSFADLGYEDIAFAFGESADPSDMDDDAHSDDPDALVLTLDAPSENDEDSPDTPRLAVQAEGVDIRI